MTSGWQMEAEQILLRWSGLEMDPQRNQLWMEGLSQANDECLLPQLPDFAAHSPLGSGEWLTPWNARWSLPSRR